jgi:hypothetical protein
MILKYTSEEYTTLMKLVYLGNWMMNGIKISEEHIRTFNDIEQKIFSDAEHYGCGALIEYDKHIKKYFPTQEFEEDAELVRGQRDYNDEIFWTELIERLAQRDFVSHYGDAAIRAMGERERKEKLSEHIKRYVDEFERHNLSRIHIQI